MKYGTTGGLYDAKKTGRGISAMVAASAKFALFQFDPSKVESCEFFSNAGAGNIILNNFYYLMLIAAGIALAAVISFQGVWW
jgi:hypothetical protein